MSPRSPFLDLAPLRIAELPAVAAAQLGDAALLAHLRWCLFTPYTRVLCATAGGALVGVGTALLHTGSGWIGQMHVAAQHQRLGIGTALVRALLSALEAEGAAAQRVCAPPDVAPFFQRQGFASEGELLRFSGGTFHEATRDEVVALAPEHLLGLLHLDRRATGEDRRRLLLEHLYLAHAYAERGRVRGVLLPLLHDGLVLADAPDVGAELLRWLLPLRTDIVVPNEHPFVRAHLARLGHAQVPYAVRMVRGAGMRWDPQLLFAAGGWC